jgi:transmembrane sensor
MNKDEAKIEQEAAAWHVASANDDMDWNGFTRWLQADSRNRRAFDEVALADALVDDHRGSLVEARGPAAEVVGGDNVVTLRPQRRWPLWLGSGIAASLAAVMIAGQVIPPAPETIESGNAARTIALGDNSTVTLAPRSRLTIGGRDATDLALEGGAYFDIKHDPARNLRITAGELTVSDVGTRFDIRQGPAQVLVEVADGEVAVGSDALASPVRLVAGRRLRFDSAASRAVVSGVESQSVGEWREGRMTYDSAPLQLVASDLARYAGARLVVPDALAQRRFSGTLFIGNGDSAIRDLAQLMELDVHRDGDAYRLEPAG